jgi:peptide/nickel transport system substrate-binding protein
MRLTLRVVIAASAAVLAWGALAAPKDSVTLGVILEPPGLDPTTGAAAAIGEVTHYNIFEGLTKINADFSVTPLLAESWSLSPDLKTLTFKLRKDVHFQDGAPFTSKDVKFSFERAAAPDSTNKEKAFFASIESIDASDPASVSLKFKQPSFDALYHLGMNSGRRVRRSHWRNGTAFATPPK